ncbi:MAG TPA: SPOR domain-containing protein [Clostridia bacterium]|nr:SPOR domain-containing protein [Clostridia bacterium]
MGHISRRRRISTNAEGSGWGNAAFAVVIIVVLYLLVTGAAGKWVAEYVINPVYNAFFSTDESNVEDPVSESIELESPAAYFIQLGEYDKQKDAEDQAALIRPRGAAGYIYRDKNTYRVFAWCYDNEADAKEVKQRLEEQENMDSIIYKTPKKSIKLKLSGRKGDVKAVRNSIVKYQSQLVALKSIIIKLDKGEMGLEGAKGELNRILTLVSDIAASIDSIYKKTNNECIEKLSKLYASFVQNLSKLSELEMQNVNECTYRVKYLYMEMYFGRLATMSELK